MPVPTGLPHGARARPTVPGARRDSRRGRPDTRPFPRGLFEVGTSSSSAPSLTIAAPDTPVNWDIPADNKPIADGLAPEKGATLQLYNYADYSPRTPSSRSRRSTRPKSRSRRSTTPTRRITKIRGGNVDYDIYFPSYDQISRLVNGGLVRPLNHSYIPNIKQRLADVHQPLVRPGVAVHGAVLRLHHRHRVAQRPGARGHRRAVESL